MDDRLAKAFDFSQDAAKQLITLSTAVVALTITFYKASRPVPGSPWWLPSWRCEQPHRRGWLGSSVTDG